MTVDRAEGSDTCKGGRVKPSAIFVSADFKPPNNPPEPLDINGTAAKAKARGFNDADAGASKFLMGRISFQHMCEYMDVIERCSADVPRSIKEANRLMTIDRRFQQILFEYIGLFELQFRTVYAREMSLRYGAFAHRNPKLFKRRDHFEGFLKEYSIPYKRISKGRDCRQRRHIQQYGDMPIWEAVEEVSLGALSKLYKNTKSAAVREAVAKSFDCDRDVFESWTSCLTVVRNQIAHFGMLLGRKLPIQPKKMPEVDTDNTEPFFVVLMLMRMLRTNMHFNGELQLMFSIQLSLQVHQLFARCSRERAALGVPNNWEDLITNPNVSGVGIEINKPRNADNTEQPISTLPMKLD